MRACVIFNPAAKGQKADRFRSLLGSIAAECELKLTTASGDARRLAAAAVQEDCDTVIAAGGDGTLNEVLNGIADVPGGLARVRLGVLPLGTINVFARELKIPRRLDAAWQVLQRGKETAVDLPRIEFKRDGKQIHFAQLAGAGLDARAIQLVSWPLKRKLGPLAYVVAGLRALTEPHPTVSVSDGVGTYSGQLVLFGNGRLYGGDFHVFPEAALTDGLLEACVFPRVNWLVLIRCAFHLLLRRKLPESAIIRLRSKAFEVLAPASVWTEVDGELAQPLPATFTLQPRGLRVLVP